jgi:type VI secretion system protein VasG
LTGALAQLCLARESGARNVDAFLNQRVLPAVSRELLTRMAGGSLPVECRLSIAADESLVIDFLDRHSAPSSANATADDLAMVAT